jgi:cytochrome c553
MPEIVAKGKQAQNVAACSLCHMPNGKGRPENAPVAGFPVEYFVKTMMDFKNDARKSSDPRKANTNRMISFAKAMTDEEILQAATYFNAMPWTQWIRVVEVSTVPKTRIQGGMFLRLEGNETEPLGNRIIEAPEDTERTEVLRDPRSGFVAYAPMGSIKRGQALATTGGNGKTIACATCHGANLQGIGPVPGIGGRSPSYLVRQMHDMQTGARKGSWSELMKPVVEKLTAEDFVSIAAVCRLTSSVGSADHSDRRAIARILWGWTFPRRAALVPAITTPSAVVLTTSVRRYFFAGLGSGTGVRYGFSRFASSRATLAAPAGPENGPDPLPEISTRLVF